MVQDNLVFRSLWEKMGYNWLITGLLLVHYG